MKPVILIGWFFFTLSWFTAPWSSGGWYVSPPIGGFATKKDCEDAAAWVQKAASPKPVIPSKCYEGANRESRVSGDEERPGPPMNIVVPVTPTLEPCIDKPGAPGCWVHRWPEKTR